MSSPRSCSPGFDMPVPDMGQAMIEVRELSKTFGADIADTGIDELEDQL